ncbi:hypothetical protein C7N43_06975 [Sphingobacteriales bacterium UPWRP_1]|nr:hypothetical protein BVG80_13425 [Sphingobacteriales bacterium TSM_CSM]PSJ77825.1 hypothetical protein C7N43_06975 [Sphingobacteriales bacterium UPWRP_1]
MKRWAIFLAALMVLASCKKDNNNTDNTDFVTGKNRFITNVDGYNREYYVHVPASYNKNAATPVVFMLHGTSGDGDKFYNDSGWKEVGDAENILTVFPSSWQHCIIDEDGQQKNTTKWNSQPSEWSYCQGEIPKDDIKFLRTVIDNLNSMFNVDNKRIYLVGFSNGGQMAAKCAVELSDKLAAVVESAGSFSFDTTFIPKRRLSVLFQRGNEDYGPGNDGPAIPMDTLNYLLTTPDLPYAFGKFYIAASTHQKTFGFSNNFTISGDTSVVALATFPSVENNPDLFFQIALVKGLKHAYPNGTLHPLHAAELNWQWLKQFSIP